MTTAADRARKIEFRSGDYWIGFVSSPRRIRVRLAINRSRLAEIAPQVA
jgi:hypothetical protein